MQINGGSTPHIFNYTELREISKGATVYKSGERVVILPKGTPPDNWHKLQGQLPNGDGTPSLRPMGKGELMRSLVASGSSHAQFLGKDAGEVQKSLLASWRAANEGKSQPSEKVIPDSIINTVKSLADSVHLKTLQDSKGSVLGS